jgi:carboxyl-terminal processing protease
MKKVFLLILLTISFLNAKNVNQNARIADYLKFMKVVNIIEKYYVEPLTLDQIIEKLLKGGVSALDPHSSFEDKKAYKSLQVMTNGEFGGLGIVISMKKGVLTVISPIDDTPAYRAGIKAGDIILKINGKATLDMTLDEDVNLMRGKPGTKITLTIVRNGKKINVTLVRAIIKIKSVKEYALKGYPNIEYVRISSFDKNVVTSLKTILNKMRNKKGLIIDLRNNPGGLLNQALGTLDLFIDKGKLLSQKGRDKRNDRTWYAHSAGTYKNIPIVILVNGGSASASEIVSGGMQDRKRAVIVGEKTFGKGSVQSIIPINKEEAVRLTIAKYYLPSGRTIQAVGVTPDIVVKPAKIIPLKDSGLDIKESELKAHLKAELQKENKHKKVAKNNKKIKVKNVNKDNQLQTAVSALKAMIILKEENK